MKKSALAIIVVVILGAATGYLWDKSPINEVKTPKAPSSTTIPKSNEPEPNAEIALTMDEVAKHSSLDSCWSVINGVVYDLTSYAPNHDGGPLKIAIICGKDGSSLFEDEHAGDDEPAEMLKTLKLGALVK